MFVHIFQCGYDPTICPASSNKTCDTVPNLRLHANSAGLWGAIEAVEDAQVWMQLLFKSHFLNFGSPRRQLFEVKVFLDSFCSFSLRFNKIGWAPDSFLVLSLGLQKYCVFRKIFFFKNHACMDL